MSCNTIQPTPCFLPPRGDLPRISSNLLPTHLQGLPVIPPFSGPSSTPLLNCPGARLGKNSLAIRFIFSRHGDSSLSRCCIKNRAVIVSRLTLHIFSFFFFFSYARFSLTAYGLIACNKCKSVCAWDGGDFTRLSRRIFANTER